VGVQPRLAERAGHSGRAGEHQTGHGSGSDGASLPKISEEMIERIIHAGALGVLGLSVPAPATGS
jgi:hypothetical protein